MRNKDYSLSLYYTSKTECSISGELFLSGITLLSYVLSIFDQILGGKVLNSTKLGQKRRGEWKEWLHAFMRLCVYGGGLFSVTSFRSVPPPGGGAARFPSLETVKTVTSPAMHAQPLPTQNVGEDSLMFSFGREVSHNSFHCKTRVRDRDCDLIYVILW
jgi:hypothetical protein